MSENDGNDPDAEQTGRYKQPRTRPPARLERRERLVVLTGDDAGVSYELGTLTTLGRASECDIRVRSPLTSRVHAKITRLPDGVLVITDGPSRHGTFVNGERIESRTLAIGDRIELGAETTLLLTIRDPLQSLLRERQKMEALGRLASGVSHDFNNISVAAQLTCDHLVARLHMLEVDDREIHECVSDLVAILGRGQELTRALSALGRRGSTRPAVVFDAATICEEVARICDRIFGSDVRIERVWQPGIWILGRHTELHQILLNLCLNARDAMPEGGVVRVQVSLEPTELTASSGGDTDVVIRVRDTGIGMDDKTRERIFEPFFTTKPPGRGSGIGLATVHQLVRDMGGHIEVESELGRGTELILRLPAAEPPSHTDEPTRRRFSKSPKGIPTQGGLILVVDDQALVRRSTGRLLSGAGYAVAYAADGASAIKLYEAADEKPCLVLLDIELPGMSGEDLLRALLNFDPEALVVMMTGHVDPSRREALLKLGAVGYLTKPFDGNVLRAAIADALKQHV